MRLAFLLFLAAGISDAVDGFLAKRFGMTTELGAYLDPLADKALIVSIYVTLGITGVIPRWLVILVVSRDIMIVGAIMLSWLVDKPVKIKPLWCRKLNTVAQIVFAGLVLAALGFRFRRRAGVDTGDGAGRGLDLAFGRPLSRRMGASHELGGSRAIDGAAPSPARWCVSMTLERQVVFWLAALAVFVAVLWLLSDILLPFVAGMALAYLLDPLADRLERLGVSRALAALADRHAGDRRAGRRCVMAGRADRSATSSPPSSTTCRAM